MNRSSLGLIIFTISLLIAGSCSTSWLTLSVLQPADTVLPASIQSISVIPMPGITSTAQQDSIDNDRDKEINSYETKTCVINGIYSILSSSPRFTRVVLSDTNTAWFIHNKEVHWEDLATVSKHDQTNCVLLLSRMASTGTRLFDPFSDAYGNYTIIETRLLFCNPQTQQSLARFTFTDTIRVAGVYESEGISQLFCYAYYTAGEYIGKRLAPYWIDVDRVIYRTPGRDLRDAAELAANGKWRNAGLLWSDLVTHRKVKIASRAAFNLAFAFERDDDLEQAWLWLEYADSLRSNSLSSAYRKVLRKRLNDREILTRQMKGN